jgi:hypothetical protein
MKDHTWLCVSGPTSVCGAYDHPSPSIAPARREWESVDGGPLL